MNSGNEQGNKKISKKGTIIAASVVGALVVIYLAGSIFFQSHYLPRTVINGISCTGKNADGVKDAITSEVKNYKLTIQERGKKSETITGKDVSISVEFDDTLQNLIGAEPRNAKIRICYYDNGTDGIRVCYISNTDRNKTVNIQKEDTNTWKWYELDVTDLINASPADTSANNGLQDEKTNFAVWGKTKEESNERDTDTYIAEIQLILE